MSDVPKGGRADSGPQESSAEVAELLEQAGASATAGRHHRAIELVDGALTLDDTNVKAWVLRARLAGSDREARLLWLHAVPFGTGIGGTAVIMPVLVGRCFGELHFSRIMGLIMSGFAIGIVVGIPGAGWIFDRTGSYEGVLIGCGLGLLLAATLALRIRPERHHDEFATAA